MIEILLPANAPDVIYDIRNDLVLQAQIREASLASGRFGLSLECGVVGSPEWWSAAETGQVPVFRFTGKILQIDGGPMGDSAIIRIAGEQELKSWTAWHGFRSEFVGALVEISYARVNPKHPPREDFKIDLILQVRLVEKRPVQNR